MMTEEEKIQERIDKAVRVAKAPLYEDLHTMTRALADEHRRVDVAVQVRQQVEIERNKLQAKAKVDEQERAGLQLQVETLHKEAAAGQKFHLDVLGHLAKLGIPTPAEGYLKGGAPLITRDLDDLVHTNVNRALAEAEKGQAKRS
jgi:hypothetical protein